MNLDRDVVSRDEYFVTALQIFEYCGGESTGTLRVDALMDKFAPFVKTNKAEFSYLKSLLDPEQTNPEISISRLARALHQYSESQKTKVDFEESFNLRTGRMPQDSDSGISTDGFQLLEELQCELREKARLTQQLRGQLDAADRQHEEALGALAAERDSLRAHLTMLREENMTLTHLRHDYEEACERLCGSETALDEARRELDSYKKRSRVLEDQVATFEIEKLTLQELLTKSKAECHRINEMYASRQSALLEQNETLRGDRADLGARLHDQDEFMQQVLKEKVLLEMELKDMLNKSNQTQLRLDRSVDVSFTEDQMLTALDTLNTDSQFSPENHLLDDESFVNALKEDAGRATNISLFDEIRLSFCNVSKHNVIEINDTRCDEWMGTLEGSFTSIGIQTDGGFNDVVNNNDEKICGDCSKDNLQNAQGRDDKSPVSVEIQTDLKMSKRLSEYCESKSLVSVEIQTDAKISKNLSECCGRINPISKQTTATVSISVGELRFGAGEDTTNKRETVIEHNIEEDRIHAKEPNNNNSSVVKGSDSKCIACEKLNHYAANLERDLKHSRCTVNELKIDLDTYERNLTSLQAFLDEGNQRNNVLQMVVRSLQTKLGVLETACVEQNGRIDGLTCDTKADTRAAGCQTASDLVSVATQAEGACDACELRGAAAPRRRLLRYMWEPIKCLFQLFAVVCFLCAVCALYGVARRAGAGARCERGGAAVPWRWLRAQDLLDALLRIEYVAEVPM